MNKMQITTNINEKYLDHFKSQLMFFEVKNSDVKIIYDGGGFQDRHELMFDLVKRSFFDCPASKKIRFWVFTGDNRPTDQVNGEPLFSISGPRIKSDFVIPDPHSFKWPQIGVNDYQSYCQEIKNNSLNYPIKKSAIWRGGISQNPIREFIVNNCNKSKNDIFDLEESNVGEKNFLHMNALSIWACLIDMPGRGFSGRLKYLLHAHRPIIVFEREDWDALTINLEPGIHYISCSADFQIFTYKVNQIINSLDYFLNKSHSTVNLISQISQRNHISSILVKKVISNSQ